MDAPVYPPAQGYEPVAFLPRPLNTSTSSINELMASPEAKAIILEEIPNFLTRIGNPLLKPHLSNFSPLSMVPFGVIPLAALGKIDARLKLLQDQAQGSQK